MRPADAFDLGGAPIWSAVGSHVSPRRRTRARNTSVPTGSIASSYLGYALSPIRSDTLAVLFGSVFSLAAVLRALFALDQSSKLELTSVFVYAAGALYGVFAGV